VGVFKAGFSNRVNRLRLQPKSKEKRHCYCWAVEWNCDPSPLCTSLAKISTMNIGLV
jgi:hypothetical protein